MTVIKQCSDANFLEYPQYNGVWHACIGGWSDFNNENQIILSATCPEADISQATDGTIRCSSGWVYEQSNKDFFKELFIEFEPGYFSLILLAAFSALAIGYGGGVVLGALRRGRNI